jgi:glycine/D-amino acid oxidase-like deaminating enzyme
VLAGAAVVAINAWAAAWPWWGRRLVTWSSYIVLTEPIPDRLAELGWTGGEGITDARFTLHYGRTTPDGRIAIGGGGGRPGLAGRIDEAFTSDALAARRAQAGLARWFPSLRDVRIEDSWGGPIDVSADHLPWYGSVQGRPIHHFLGYSGNGVSASIVGARILAARALERLDDPALALPMAAGPAPRSFPPEPARYLGAALVREAAARRESSEERGEPVSPLLRELSRMPRRLGYHLGPD